MTFVFSSNIIAFKKNFYHKTVCYFNLLKTQTIKSDERNIGQPRSVWFSGIFLFFQTKQKLPLSTTDNRGFSEVDHSDSAARIVLEQNKFSKKVSSERNWTWDPSTLVPLLLSYKHTERQGERQIEYIGSMVTLGNGSGTDFGGSQCIRMDLDAAAAAGADAHAATAADARCV